MPTARHMEGTWASRLADSQQDEEAYEDLEAEATMTPSRDVSRATNPLSPRALLRLSTRPGGGASSGGGAGASSGGGGGSGGGSGDATHSPLHEPRPAPSYLSSMLSPPVMGVEARGGHNVSSRAGSSTASTSLAGTPVRHTTVSVEAGGGGGGGGGRWESTARDNARVRALAVQQAALQDVLASVESIGGAALPSREASHRTPRGPAGNSTDNADDDSDDGGMDEELAHTAAAACMAAGLAAQSVAAMERELGGARESVASMGRELGGARASAASAKLEAGRLRRELEAAREALGAASDAVAARARADAARERADAQAAQAARTAAALAKAAAATAHAHSAAHGSGSGGGAPSSHRDDHHSSDSTMRYYGSGASAMPTHAHGAAAVPHSRVRSLASHAPPLNSSAGGAQSAGIDAAMRALEEVHAYLSAAPALSPRSGGGGSGGALDELRLHAGHAGVMLAAAKEEQVRTADEMSSLREENERMGVLVDGARQATLTASATLKASDTLHTALKRSVGLCAALKTQLETAVSARDGQLHRADSLAAENAQLHEQLQLALVQVEELTDTVMEQSDGRLGAHQGSQVPLPSIGSAFASPSRFASRPASHFTASRTSPHFLSELRSATGTHEFPESPVSLDRALQEGSGLLLAEYRRAKAELRTSAAEMRALGAELEDAQGALANCRAQLGALGLLRDAVEGALGTTGQRSSVVSSSADDLRELAATAAAQLRAAPRLEAQLQDAVANEEALARARSELSRTQRNLVEQQARLLEGESQLQDAGLAMRAAKARLTEERARGDEAEAAQKLLGTRLADANARVTSLEAQVATAQAQAEASKRAAALLSEQVGTTSSELAAKTTELARHRTDLAKAGAMLEDERLASADRVRVLEREGEALRAATRGKGQELSLLRSQLEDCLEVERSLRSELLAARVSAERSSGEVARMEGQAAEMAARLQAAMAAEASLRSERGALTSSAHALVTTMASMPAASASFHAASSGFHAAFADAGGGSQAQHGAPRSGGGSLAAAMHAGAAAGAVDADAALAELDEEMLLALAGQVEDREVAAQLMRRRMASAKAAVAARMRGMEAELDAAQTAIIALKAEVQRRDAIIAQLRAAGAGAGAGTGGSTGDVRALRASVAQQASRIAHLEGELKASEGMMADVEAALQDLLAAKLRSKQPSGDTPTIRAAGFPAASAHLPRAKPVGDSTHDSLWSMADRNRGVDASVGNAGGSVASPSASASVSVASAGGNGIGGGGDAAGLLRRLRSPSFGDLLDMPARGGGGGSGAASDDGEGTGNAPVPPSAAAPWVPPGSDVGDGGGGGGDVHHGTGDDVNLGSVVAPSSVASYDTHHYNPTFNYHGHAATHPQRGAGVPGIPEDGEYPDGENSRSSGVDASMATQTSAKPGVLGLGIAIGRGGARSRESLHGLLARISQLTQLAGSTPLQSPAPSPSSGRPGAGTMDLPPLDLPAADAADALARRLSAMSDALSDYHDATA
ncbi:hypothetical protein FOA52_002828 [Chlamydomonas sp. UWO 241]|nr:hypothetical protein FOA52_002828 [Chlamydomonas sp. UWO 241]